MKRVKVYSGKCPRQLKVVDGKLRTLDGHKVSLNDFPDGMIVNVIPYDELVKMDSDLRLLNDLVGIG